MGNVGRNMKKLVILSLLFITIFSSGIADAEKYHVTDIEIDENAEFDAEMYPVPPVNDGGLEQEGITIRSSQAAGNMTISDTEKIRRYLPYGSPGNDSRILYRTGYIASYSEELKLSEWVCYSIKPSSLARKADAGRETWTEDPYLPQEIRVKASDYRKDRTYEPAHLYPPADAVSNQLKVRESYYYSNAVPMNPELYKSNWSGLESEVRKWVQKRGALNICTGPIFYDPENHGSIVHAVLLGSRVAIPHAFYKVILSKHEGRIETIAFIMENRKQYETDTMENLIVPVDYIEEITHLDFFNKLPDSIETPLEASKSVMWE